MNNKLIISLLLLVFALSSCGDSGKSDSKTSLKLAVMPSMDYLPLAVAAREGYFEKQNLTVEIVPFMSAAERDVAFQGRVVDGGVTDYTSAALLQNGGFDMKLTSKCQAPFYIVASKASGVADLADLKGKKIAVSQNTVIDFCVDMALQSVGIAAAEVNKVEVNKIPLRFEMLRNAEIDATALPNPFALIAAADDNRLVVSMDSLGYTVTGMVFSQAAIDEKANAIRRLYAAYNEGVAYLNTHSVADITDILVAEMKFPPAVAATLVLPRYHEAQPVGATDRDVAAVVAWMTQKNLLPPSFDATSFINPDLTR